MTTQTQRLKNLLTNYVTLSGLLPRDHEKSDEELFDTYEVYKGIVNTVKDTHPELSECSDCTFDFIEDSIADFIEFNDAAKNEPCIYGVGPKLYALKMIPVIHDNSCKLYNINTFKVELEMTFFEMSANLKHRF